MCTIILLIRPGHDWPLIVGANRDEMTDRPWHPPAAHWPDRPHLVAGRDALAGGTWLGINEFGLIAGILNRKGSLGPKDGFRSRGELPLEALDHADAADAAQALAAIEPTSYRPFNMVVADNRDAYWLRLGEDDGGVLASALPPGLSMITSGERNDSAEPRIRAYLPQFQKASPPRPEHGDFTAWQQLLAGRIFDTGAGSEGAMCITGRQGFGTVSSSLIALPAPGERAGKAHWLFCPGRPGEVEYEPVALP
jgi:uncharacterized protein with NRDE domain